MTLPILVLAALLVPFAARAAEAGYTLGVPRAPKIRDVSSAGGNAWLAANANFTAMAVSATSNAVSTLDVAGADAVVLASEEAGFALERTKPEYYLGDKIVPPDGVDWSATYTQFLRDKPSGILFDPADERVFVTEGGTIRFTWVLEDGSSVPMSYVASASCAGRPRRIYWTDEPYNGPGIDLNGKFVKLFGSPDILSPRYGSVTNTAVGVEQVITNMIVSGLCIDTSTHMLQAHGQLQGQVVMAYYDTGTYERMLHVQAVEVCRPSVNILPGEIGRALKPDGRGYGTDGLRARPTVVMPSDDRGEYLYQHKGQYSYSPKNGSVYPLRPTKDCRWNAEVYWMETDEMEVQWPFELDHYECDWPTGATVFVRGDVSGDTGRPIYIPRDYTATLMNYQEPDGHARAPSADGTFATVGEGHSLLRLTTDDNIWFVPVHSVFRSNIDYFTLESETIAVGRELQLRGGSVAGTAGDFSPSCDAASPGYIYAATSDRVWNPNLYIAPAPFSASATNQTASASSGDTNTYASVVYAVTAKGDPKLEVWWNTTIREADMPADITIPTLPQVYSIRWPKKFETPEIVIASQLGSASESLSAHNAGLYLEADDSRAALADRAYFAADGGTVMFWVRCPEETGDAEKAALLSLYVRDAEGNVGTYAVFDVQRREGEARLNLSCAAGSGSLDIPDDDAWHHIACTIAGSGDLTLYCDGESKTTVSAGGAGIPGENVGAVIGATELDGGRKARVGAEIGEVLFWGRTLSGAEIAAERHRVHNGTENALTGCYSFHIGADLEVTGTDYRTFTGKVLKGTHTAYKCLCEEEGPPAIGTGVIDADADTTPKVYVQNDPEKTGYNPNEEHAFVRSGSGGHVAWALRSDLNTDESSEPGVLVEYVKDGKKAMRWFDVAVTNSVYPELAGDCVAGKALPGPHPLDLFDDPWRPETHWDEPSATSPAHRDRKGQLWARAAGRLNVRMYYPMQDGFAFPALDRSDWPAVGASVPWLSLLDGTANAAAALTRPPAAWLWRVSWPEAVPEMEIGRTLTVAASGLPEVWNCKSVGVVWPATDAERDATAVLFDPTVAQTSGFPKTTYATVADAIADLGIKQGAGGNGTLRKGRWTFDGLPPSISKWFYLDTTADVTQCLKLEGEQEDNGAGVALLHVNVLNDAEREVLAGLLDETASAAGKAAWRTAIAALAKTCVKPSPHVAVSDTEDGIAYAPRDHYALFSMGATNYVTLIENDATNALMNVSDGDPISMHIVKVVPKYYTGRVVTREDPLNLLSQQLSIIYAEAFAGEPGQYVFEWRKCQPHLDGSVPTDFDGEYEQKFAPTNGLTRFVIGQQGDTLANMVNTYYAVRYRAAGESSPAYAAMGDAWSEWSDPPALAEGWVQRVLNNVTPFAQRMRDLAANEAETPVSMIHQAGAPYEGDVALSPDNLASVGLIQLYETILSKAESMSLQLGIDDADANKQLQLAVARLADLYNVLGDEAYTDALNPTIGFGVNFDNTQMTGFELDYAALSSTLFAFDNQVPTLLDEELALLRGRTGDNAPSTHISPYYNRLVWNFTKGITAGEVAYAVNYDISGNNKGVIDANDAADMFPQGHGDAYGHYLSALSGYYRLLRNPYFTWGPPAMGEMVVADAVVNVDYYDEAQFAKTAYNVAKVALEAVDRTARKSYRDEGGASGAGYLDNDKTRNFGYGEWASRGGFGALCNWAVGNALLEAQPKSGGFVRFDFTGEDSAIWTDLVEDDVPELAADGNWTVEFQLVPSAQSGNGQIVSLADDAFLIDFSLDSSLKLSVGKSAMSVNTELYNCKMLFFVKDGLGADDFTEDIEYTEFAVTNGHDVCEFGFFGGGAPTRLPEGFTLAEGVYPEWNGWICSNKDESGNVVPFESVDGYERYDVGDERSAEDVCTLSEGEGVLVALRSARGVQTAAVFNMETGAKIAEKTLALGIGGEPHMVALGEGYTGEIGELRVWEDVVRTDAELLAKRDFASPLSDGLALYLRPIATAPADMLADETDATILWQVEGGRWLSERESGMTIGFEDEGLKRIDRSTVTELSSLADMIPSIQKKVDQMDAGLNPLGLAVGAIPFDITPIGEGDDAKTHFEQIRERAGTALANARKSLDKAQFYGSRTRMLQESQFSREDQLETMELEMKGRLIEYFGYPYAGDIGPGGTYPQGYDGPDLIHYAWMEPETCGLSRGEDVKSVTKSIYKFDVAKYTGGAANGVVEMYNFYDKTGQMEYEFEKSASGIVLKPSSITGKRRAQGRIQDELGNLLAAYGNFKSAVAAWDVAIDQFDYENTTIWSKFARDHALMVLKEANFARETVATWGEAADKMLVNTLDTTLRLSGMVSQATFESVPSIVGAGMTVNVDPSAVASAATLAPRIATFMTQGASLIAAKNALVANDGAATTFEVAIEAMEAANDYVDRYDDYYQRMLAAAEKVNDAAGEVRSAFIELQTAQCAVETVIAEAERVIDERTLARQQAADALTKTRYSEMFFRIARNNALSRFSTQFDLAQKYTYLAAQAYDYETGLLSSDRRSGDAFISRIVGARTLGEFDDDGDPTVASDAAKGDGGLAAILAELDANWLVLKPRLGINNPQSYATWFSLRHDCFRIYDEDDGDRAWKTELRKYVVEDLNSLPEFRHYCQPLAGSAAQKEPGLVIPFPSLIAHGYNFFGQKLAGGDSALDATYYATHIASAGVHFEGFDDGVFAKTPTAYLVPVGEDRMRAVGDRSTILSWKVVDQTIPAPFMIGSTQLDDPDWTPLYDGATGGNDLGARIRRHPSFRAYYDDEGKEPKDDELDCTWLIGRSAWNTKWLLIIPAGSLGADREAALSAFVNGVDSNRDGKLDFKGVADIKIGLKTYSTSGN